MIVGIGTDIIEIQRVNEALEKHGEAFAKKVLAPEELTIFFAHNKKAHYLAKRWAAKEALGKALGTGIRAPVLLPKIALLNDDLGKPYFQLTNEIVALLNQRAGRGENYQLHVSVSDEKNYATALVIFEILTK